MNAHNAGTELVPPAHKITAKSFMGQEIVVCLDNPIPGCHKRHGMAYPVSWVRLGVDVIDRQVGLKSPRAAIAQPYIGGFPEPRLEDHGQPLQAAIRYHDNGEVHASPILTGTLILLGI